ncbi:unnamed protein product [Meganyctiphanes norvegica]|uniref:Cuticle protein n=1 Tax=Meganyctiphanes norvegica TaxID=48144 RepID=A0AAV2QNV2_MEGNR
MQGLIIAAASLVASVVALPAKLPGHNLIFSDDHDALHAHVDHGHEDPLIAVPSVLSNTFAGYNYEEPRGYNYAPPAVPSGLYETPVTTTTTTTTTTTPPPPPPAAYLPPVRDEIIPQPSNPIPEILPPAKPMMLMPYNIGWGVSDNEYGVQMNHVEDSDGANVNGEYSVLLPDGRMQIVRFTSDAINGYQAEVIYQ